MTHWFRARLKTLVLTLLPAFVIGGAANAQERTVDSADPNNVLVLETDLGPVYIELWPDVAPQHVERFKTLAREGFYDGIVFHRVIPGFMAQSGDPLGTGMGGSELEDLPAEFSDKPFVRGTLGMARSASPNSANSQFFITFGRTRHLDGQYTVVGQVLDGMKFIDRIAPGEPPANPDSIVTMRVLSDIQ